MMKRYLVFLTVMFQVGLVFGQVAETLDREHASYNAADLRNFKDNNYKKNSTSLNSYYLVNADDITLEMLEWNFKYLGEKPVLRINGLKNNGDDIWAYYNSESERYKKYLSLIKSWNEAKEHGFQLVIFREAPFGQWLLMPTEN